MRQLASIVIALTTLTGALSAASIEFQQGGWSSGGPLSVAFTGEDADQDGTLGMAELTDFQAMWGLPSGGFTTWELPHIQPDGFLFTDVGNFLIFVRNAEYSLVNTAFEGEVLASVFDSFLFPVAASTDPVSAVPEPSSAALLAIGGLILLTRRKLRRSAA